MPLHSLLSKPNCRVTLKRGPPNYVIACVAALFVEEYNARPKQFFGDSWFTRALVDVRCLCKGSKHCVAVIFAGCISAAPPPPAPLAALQPTLALQQAFHASSGQLDFRAPALHIAASRGTFAAALSPVRPHVPPVLLGAALEPVSLANRFEAAPAAQAQPQREQAWDQSTASRTWQQQQLPATALATAAVGALLPNPAFPQAGSGAALAPAGVGEQPHTAPAVPLPQAQVPGGGLQQGRQGGGGKKSARKGKRGSAPRPLTAEQQQRPIPSLSDFTSIMQVTLFNCFIYEFSTSNACLWLLSGPDYLSDSRGAATFFCNMRA